MVFTYNVMEAIQEKYGKVEDWASWIQRNGEPDINAVKFFMIESINEGIDIENEKNNGKREPLTGKQVGRIMTEAGLAEVAKKINITITEGIGAGTTQKNEETTKSPAKK